MQSVLPPAPKRDVRKLTEAQRTLLIPLWARAEEAQRTDALIDDPKAVELVNSIDFDFNRFRRAGAPPAGFCIRAAIGDRFVREFLDAHPDGTVVEIGAGLDTRFERIDNGRVRWFDLDLPEVIDVRRRFFQETDRRVFLETSVLEAGWQQRVAQPEPRAVLFVAEGVLYFLSRDQVAGLFSSLADRFAQSSIVFDCMSPLFLAYSNRNHPFNDSRLRWGLRRIEQIEGWDPRFQVEESIGFGNAPDYTACMGRFPLPFRIARYVCPPCRRMFTVNRVRLG